MVERTVEPERDGLVESAGGLIPVLRGQPDLGLAFGQRHDRDSRETCCRLRPRPRLFRRPPMIPACGHLVEAVSNAAAICAMSSCGVRRVQEQREPVLNVNAAVAQVIEQQARERPIRVRLK